jgi:hypothetical protein
MSYGKMFCGGSTNVQRVFIMQKRIIRVMMNRGPRDSGRKIMTFYSQYIYALLLFMINNKICLWPIMSYMSIKLEYIIIYIYLWLI